MLLVLNRRALPDEIGLKGWRSPIVAVTALLFIGPLLFLLYSCVSVAWIVSFQPLSVMYVIRRCKGVA